MTNLNFGTPPKKYVALLTQIGTGDPTVTVLENSIGDIVWSRGSVGHYSGTLTGAFHIPNTVIFITPGRAGSGSLYGNILISQIGSEDSITIWTKEGYDNTFSDNHLGNVAIEIRVYS